MAARTRLDFWYDAALLAGYTLAYSYGFTGIAIHEWLGIALGLALLFHLTLHWDWVIQATRKLFGPRGHDKLIWAVNLLLMLAMVMCVVSGIVISRVALPSMGINPQIGPSWQRFHILTRRDNARPGSNPRGAALALDRPGRAMALGVALGQAGCEAGSMKLVRQLAVATLVIAVVVVLSVVADHLASGR